jgi:AbrB family looped-hinge helix DNA binding protein
MKAAVSEKGQVTIPKALRDKLGIRPGQVMEFEARNGLLVGRKADAYQDPLAEITGILELKESVDEYLEAIRGKGAK